MTRQRRVILEELREAESHPSADEVYETVRRRMPHISLATVYRNLEMLAERGLIRKIDLAGSAMRFDGDLTEHYHVRCAGCGQVGDVRLASPASLKRALRGKTEYELHGHRLEFVGLCPRCRESGDVIQTSGARNGLRKPVSRPPIPGRKGR